MSVEDVTNLISQQASATQKTQQVAALMSAADKFGLTPEDLVTQAEGAFAVMSDLIEKQVIDNKGNIIAKALTTPPEPAPAVKPTDSTGLVKRMETIEASLAKLPDRIDLVERDQTNMIRLDLQRNIQAKHKNLSDDDVTKLFGIAMRDKTQTVWQHAEVLSKANTQTVADIRTTHAKEFGIDLEVFDANKLNEQDAKGGAGVLFKDKKFSFKKGEGAVTPRQATQEFFKNVHSKG